jgi:hypothetical protein
MLRNERRSKRETVSTHEDNADGNHFLGALSAIAGRRAYTSSRVSGG